MATLYDLPASSGVTKAMKKQELGFVLEQARLARDVSRPELARQLAKSTEASAKGIEGQLWRYEKGERQPSVEKLQEIADALSMLANDGNLERDRLLDDLMEAAGIEKSDYQKSYLRRQCVAALRDTELGEHEIESVLDQVSDATMMRIAEAARKGEEIEVMDLRSIASDLGGLASSRPAPSASKDSKGHEIAAGRAVIRINGSLSKQQKRLLHQIADLIETVLKD
jgi:transcriptional regulator with XRE-family HTH domain